jgi:uncharacterized membrane protein YfcA
MTYIVMLGIIGIYMFFESLNNLRTLDSKQRDRSEIEYESYIEENNTIWINRVYRALPVQIHFEKSDIKVSVFVPLTLGALVGILAAIMGVGGGFIMVPVMIYILRMPMHVAVGTNLFQEVIICLNVAFMQSYYNQTVDIILALILLSGSTIGAQFGARVSDRLKADQLKIILASIVLLVMLQITIGLLIQPSLLLSVKGGH